MCIPCFDYAGWENTHDDDGHDSDNLDDHCPVCHPERDPRHLTVKTGHTNTVAKNSRFA